MIGGNGAGKSTLLNLIAGVHSVDEGSIELDGQELTRLPEYKRAALFGRVFQDPMLGTASNMQIEENMALAHRRGRKRGLRWGVTKEEKEVFHEELKRLGDLAHLTLPQLREKVHSTPDGLLIQAHPFRGYVKCQDAALLDGVEVFNGNPRHDSHNDRALAFAQANHLLMTAGSDVHESMDPGGALMVCPPFADIREFARLVRAGRAVRK